MASFSSLPEEILPLIFSYNHFAEQIQIQTSTKSKYINPLSICLISRRTLYYGRSLLYHVVGIHLHELHHKLHEGASDISRALVLNSSNSFHTKVLNLAWILTQEHNSIGLREGDYNSTIVQHSLVQSRIGYLKQMLNNFSRLKSLNLAGRLEGFNLLLFCLQELGNKSLQSVSFQGVRDWDVGEKGFGIVDLMESLKLHSNLYELSIVDPPLGMILPSPSYRIPMLPLRRLTITGGVSEGTDWTEILITSSHTTLTHLVINVYSGFNLSTKLISQLKFPNLISLQINLYSEEVNVIREFMMGMNQVLELQSQLLELKLLTGITQVEINMNKNQLLSPLEEINLYTSLPIHLTLFKSNFVQFSESMRNCWRMGAFQELKELWVFRNEKWEDVRMTRLMGY